MYIIKIIEFSISSFYYFSLYKTALQAKKKTYKIINILFYSAPYRVCSVLKSQPRAHYTIICYSIDIDEVFRRVL